MRNSEIIRKHITIHKTDLQYLNEIVKSHEKINTISQAVSYIITSSNNFDELKNSFSIFKKNLKMRKKKILD